MDPSVICHTLALDPKAKLVAQRKRKLSEERRKLVAVETHKLVEAGFVQEIKYTMWLTNVVLVKKAIGKWRMCVDFIDLNKAYPKDSYLLPNIDQLVDRTAGYQLLSFIDAYSGYNQIRMHPKAEEKTTFTSDKANCCYKPMPFILKNTSATYQRLVDKVFTEQIGRNIEVYRDDIVVKLECQEGHKENLEETFQRLKQYNIRLNPEKCSFGVKGGKFLSFLLISRGIDVNLTSADPF